MHLLIGSLLSLLLSKKSFKSKTIQPKLGYRGIIELKHALPGRIRYKIPKLSQYKNNLKQFKKQLLSINGIKDIEFNPVSGSVLVFYDETGIEPIYIFAALVKLFGLEPELERPPQSAVGKELNDITSSLDRAAYEYTRGLLDLKTGVPLLLIIVALYQLFVKRNMGLPGALTFLWWAYAMLSKRI